MDHATADDRELVAAASAGDQAAFETLVRRHARAVYAHALRFFGDPMTAEEVAQDVFIKVFRSLGTFDGRSRFTTWLYQVTRNTCLDEVRAGRRRPLVVDHFEEDVLVGDFSDAVAVSSSLESAVRTLPPEDRDALSAVALFGLSYAEAARSLNVPEGTVKSRVFRARRTLAAALGLSSTGRR